MITDLQTPATGLINPSPPKVGDVFTGTPGIPDGTWVKLDWWDCSREVQGGKVQWESGHYESYPNLEWIVTAPPTRNDLVPDDVPAEQEVTYKLVVTLWGGGEDTYTFDEDCDIETENGELTIRTDGVFAAVYAPGEWKSAVRKEIKS